jgi:hypothetical protein
MIVVNTVLVSNIHEVTDEQRQNEDTMGVLYVHTLLCGYSDTGTFKGVHEINYGVNVY